MINQNITFHLPKYNSNMFCVLKVITDKLTLLCLTMYSAIFLQSSVRPKPNDITCAYQIPWWLTPQAPWNVVNPVFYGAPRQAGGKGGAEGAEGNFT